MFLVEGVWVGASFVLVYCICNKAAGQWPHCNICLLELFDPLMFVFLRCQGGAASEGRDAAKRGEGKRGKM